ncbi:hypothetical protein LL946_06055 [Knoellia locipacati]|uniref:hypothetical protein n=1 Tax=Knoellia locipacati TaxID=882824 RepID=UPI00384FC0A8
MATKVAKAGKSCADEGTSTMSNDRLIGDSLYTLNAISTSEQGEPEPLPPGTSLTASVETIDNDRASLMLDADVIR